MEEVKIEQNVDGITINTDKLYGEVRMKPRKNRSALQFNGDEFFTLYTETKFNKFQKFLWKHLLNIKIMDVEE